MTLQGSRKVLNVSDKVKFGLFIGTGLFNLFAAAFGAFKSSSAKSNFIWPLNLIVACIFIG